MLQVSATTKVGKSKVELRAFATSGDKDGLAASQSHGLTAQQMETTS